MINMQMLQLLNNLYQNINLMIKIHRNQTKMLGEFYIFLTQCLDHFWISCLLDILPHLLVAHYKMCHNPSHRCI